MRLKNVLLLSLILLFTAQISYAQKGQYFIKNFSQKEYKGALQNWCIAQDHRGVIYVGNNGALLEFDGVRWRYIPIQGAGIIRSIDINDRGIIYIGGDDDLGYLQPDLEGHLKFISFKELLPQNDYPSSSIWKTYCNGNKTYFYTTQKLYIWNGRKFTVTPVKEGSLAQYDKGNLFVQNFKTGLEKLVINKMEPCKGTDALKGKSLFSVHQKSDETFLLGTGHDGLFEYNEETAQLNMLEGSANSLLKKSRIYCSAKINNKYIAYGTMKNGIILVDLKGNLVDVINTKTGLQDNAIYALKTDNQGGLWVAMGKGISRIEINSHITYFNKQNNIESVLKKTIRFNGKLYLGTFNGLYELSKDGSAKRMEGFDNIIWDIIEVNNHLFIATTNGIFTLNKKGKKEKLSDTPAFTFSHNGAIIWVGLKDGITVIQAFDDEFILHENAVSLGTNILNIATLDNSNIFIGTRKQGIWRLNISEDKITKFGIKEGLPALTGNKLFVYQDKICVATKSGLRQFTENENFDFIPSLKEFSILNTNYINQIKTFGTNQMIFSTLSKNNQKSFILHGEEKLSIDSVSLSRVPNMDIMDIFTENNKIWIAGSEGLFKFDSRSDLSKIGNFKASIRQMKLGTDSILFNGAHISNDSAFTYIGLNQHPDLYYYIPYDKQLIQFEFGATAYDASENIQYRYKLKGFDKNWSTWSKANKKEYTNITEGKYSLQLQAKNAHGMLSNIDTYSFTILPPWYRSIIAYIGYGVSAILIFFGGIKLNARRLEAEKKHLEEVVKERTSEIRKKKDEIELQNVQLESQKEEILTQQDQLQLAFTHLEKLNIDITKKNKHITESIEYAKYIQNAILPNKQFCEPLFKDHMVYFRPKDQVSGDFFWVHEIDENNVIWAAADCTGHGVPGSLMTMICNSALNSVLIDKKDIDLAASLDKVRAEIISTLNKEGGEERKDGMDIALCHLNRQSLQLNFAGAYNPLYINRKGKIIEQQADSHPVGKYMGGEKPFTNHSIQLEEDDRIYTFSDGYMDQIGGKQMKRFGKKRFHRVLLDHENKSFEELQTNMDKALKKWKGELVQTDDIVIFGVQI